MKENTRRRLDRTGSLTKEGNENEIFYLNSKKHIVAV